MLMYWRCGPMHPMAAATGTNSGECIYVFKSFNLPLSLRLFGTIFIYADCFPGAGTKAVGSIAAFTLCSYRRSTLYTMVSSSSRR